MNGLVPDESRGAPSLHWDDDGAVLPATLEKKLSHQDAYDAATDAQSQDIVIVNWNGPDDPENPKNFSTVRKVLITATALVCTLIAQLNGTSIAVAAGAINEQFGISDAHFLNSYWPITSWNLGGAVFVLLGLPLLEDLGVQLGFLLSYIFFFLMVIPQALAPNFATLIITRFFAGGCVTLLANVASSVIPDIWLDDRARSLPVGIWILTYMSGATLGPPLFTGIMQHIGNWRWVFYTQLIIYGAFFPFFLLCLRETRGSVILRRRAKKLRKQTGKPAFAAGEVNHASSGRGLVRAICRPFYLVFTEPVLAGATLWSAFATGTLYTFTQSVEQVFSGVYGWDSYSTGYVQIAVLVGEVIGWLLSMIGTRWYFQSARRNTEIPNTPIPEARLYVSIATSFLGLSGGMFVYAWTSYPSVAWIAPAIGIAMVGTGITSVVIALADYIVDAYSPSGYAGSAVSAIAAGEGIVAGLLPLATLPMYTNLGYNWASTLLGLIALLISFAPVVFVWKGRWFREKSPFMLSAGKSWSQT